MLVSKLLAVVFFPIVRCVIPTDVVSGSLTEEVFMAFDFRNFVGGSLDRIRHDFLLLRVKNCLY